MPNLTAPSLTFPAKSFPGAGVGSPSGIVGEALTSQLAPWYSTLVKSGKVQTAYATTTAPVIYSTAANTGGPILCNSASSGVDCHIIAVSVLTVVASAVAGGLGFTGGVGVVPAGTAIDAFGNALSGGPLSAVSVYRRATPPSPGTFFLPFAQVDTGALTVSNMTPAWIPIDGGIIVPPGAWASVAGSATLTTAQLSIGLIWAEIPS